MPEITLQDLNAHFLAGLLPATHGAEAVAAAAKAEKAAAKTAAKAAPAAPQYTAEQLAVLSAAGIADPATADPQVVAAMLGLPPVAPKE